MRNQFYKNRFVAWWLIRPFLSISITLHALLLLMPLPAGQKFTQERVLQPKEVRINLIQLPRDSPKNSASPTPKPSMTPSPTVSQQSPPPSQPPSVSQYPSLVVKPQSPKTLPQSTSSVPKLPPATPSLTPTPSPVAPSPNLNIPFADFPHLAGAQAGCLGQVDCHQIDGVGFRNATQILEQQMAKQGYQVQVRDDLEDSGQKIYELTAQDGTTRYLSVLSSDLGATRYLLASEPISLTDLQKVATTQQNLEALLDQVGSGTAIASQFPDPDSFFTGVTPRPEISKLRLAPSVKPDQFANTLTNQLQASGFSLTPVGTYAGGRMYQVGQKAFTGYLNLLSTQDKTGTILILWTTLPG